jgi:hypothetical protein
MSGCQGHFGPKSTSAMNERGFYNARRKGLMRAEPQSARTPLDTIIKLEERVPQPGEEQNGESVFDLSYTKHREGPDAGIRRAR